MILINLHIRPIIITAVIIVSCTIKIHSQGIDINSGKQGRFVIGINLSPVKTTITNVGISEISKNLTSEKNSYSGSVEAGYMFSRFFGVSTGVGYSSYTSDISLGSYDDNYDTLDADNDTYKRYIMGKSISETQNISYLSIPLALIIQLPFGDKVGFQIQSGVNLLFAMNSTYKSSGTFDYEGYYPKYNVRVSDIPFEGFEKGYLNDEEGVLRIAPFNTDFFASGGMYVNIQKKLQLSLGAIYRKVLSDIADYDQVSSFRLSSMPDNLNSMMAGSEKVTAQSFGINFGIRYFFK
jgi:hypothetical protein